MRVIRTAHRKAKGLERIRNVFPFFLRKLNMFIVKVKIYTRTCMRVGGCKAGLCDL